MPTCTSLTCAANAKPSPGTAANITTLPDELLSHIFLVAKAITNTEILDQHLEEPDGYFRLANAQLSLERTITQTCTRFRQVLYFETPRFWTTVYVHSSTVVERLKDQLQMSGACLLDVTVELLGQWGRVPADDPNLVAAVDQVLLHSARWRSLEVDCSVEDGARPLVGRLCEARTPRLHHLSLAVKETVATASQRAMVHSNLPHIFGDDPPPSLDFVRLRGTALYHLRPSLIHTTTLHLDQNLWAPLRYETVRTIITSATSLVHLSLYGDIVPPDSWPMRPGDIPLPHLRSLRISAISAGTYSGVLLSIEAPQLESLTLQGVHEHDLDPVWEWDEDGRFSALRSLILCDFEFRAFTYAKMFRVFPSINSFHSLYCRVDESQLLGLLGNLQEGYSIEGVQGVPWPELRTMSFIARAFWRDKKEVERLLEARHPFFSSPSRVLRRVSREGLEERRANERGHIGGLSTEVVCVTEVWPGGSMVFDSGDDLFS